MSIFVISTLAVLGLALTFLALRRRRSGANPTDPDGPRTLMPGMKA